MKAYLFGILLACLFVSVSAFANSLPEENQKLEAEAQLALRASSPDASFGTKGEKIGWIQAGEGVRVVSAKQHLTVFGLEVWVEVVSLRDESVKGWVFNGMSADVLKGRGKLKGASEEGALVAKR
jgi:hypothetical protein